MGNLKAFLRKCNLWSEGRLKGSGSCWVAIVASVFDIRMVKRPSEGAVRMMVATG